MPPRLLALDSSCIGDLARDVANASSPRHRDAVAFTKLLASETWIPALSLLQINEIAQHGNPRVVEQRVRFLQSLRRIAWIRNTITAPHWPVGIYFGSVMDLYYNEVASWWSGATPSSICSSLRDSVFVVAEDLTFVEAMVHDAAASRLLLDSDQKARSVASMTYALWRIAPNLTVGELRRRFTRDPATVQSNLSEFSSRLKSQLAQARDPRATQLESELLDTLDDFASTAAAMTASSAADPVAAYLRLHGLAVDDVDDATTFRDIGDLVAFRRNLNTILASRSAQVAASHIKQVRPSMLPSYHLELLVRRHQIKQDRPPEGGDIIDASIAPMGLYADMAIVDKRTCAALISIRRQHPELARIMCRTLKWSGPAAALAALSS